MNQTFPQSTPTSTPYNSTVTEFVKLIGNTFNLDQFTSEIVTSIIIFLSSIFIAWVGHAIFERYFTRLAKKTSTDLDDKILNNVKAPIFLIAIFIGAYYSINTFSSINPDIKLLISQVFIVLEIFTIAFTLTRITNVIIDWYGARRAKQCVAVSNHLLFVLSKVVQITIYLAALLIVLFMYVDDLSGLVVGLGVGGIAIAFALQNTLSDFFSAFSIYFDRPFEIGDFIVIGEYSGTVTKIGVKSTRLQLLQGEELVVSNKELTASSLRNFKRLQKRRVLFTIGVTYDTPLEKLKKIPFMIEQMIKRFDLVDFDRVHFTEFGDYSLKFEVVYYLKTADYLKYMDTKQAINFEIMAAFEKEGIKMAFPTQTLYMKREKAVEDVEMAVPTQTIFVKKKD